MGHHGAFDFLQDLTVQTIGGCEVHLGDLLKACTSCGKVFPLVDEFGQLRCMDKTATPLVYRSQPQCKKCR